MKSIIILCVISVLSFVCAQEEDQVLLDVIDNRPELEVFHTILSSSKPPLDRRLGDESLKTVVFAPTNDAFKALIKALTGNELNTVNEMTEALASVFPLLDQANKNDPTVPSTFDLLFYHIRFGLARLFRLRNSEFNTGTKFVDPGTGKRVKLGFFNVETLVDRDPAANATIGERNIEAKNGFLNIIDSVLLPVPAQTFLDLLGAPPPAQESSSPLPPASSATPSSSVASDEVNESDSAEPAPPTDSSEPTPPMDSTEPGSTMDSSMEPTASGAGDTEDNDDDGVCFPGSSMVHLSNGDKVRMDKLQSGHEVLIHNDKIVKSSKIYLFTHRQFNRRTKFVKITTSCNQILTLTSSHYIRDHKNHLISAGSVKKSLTKLSTVKGICDVVDTESVHGKGLYAPHSLHGDLVVDGVVVSSYSKAIHPSVAHAVLSPIRFLVDRFNFVEPLGNVLYNGADWTLRFLPKGGDIVKFD